jgi:hypothetical protein
MKLLDPAPGMQEHIVALELRSGATSGKVAEVIFTVATDGTDQLS